MTPDGVKSVPVFYSNGRFKAYADASWYEVKTTARISRSSSDYQILGFFDALRTAHPSAVSMNRANITFVTPYDTVIGRSTMRLSRNYRIDVHQMVAYVKGDATSGYTVGFKLSNSMSIFNPFSSAKPFVPLTR